MDDLEHARYPLGRVQLSKEPPAREARAALIGEIERAPAAIRSLVEPLTDAQLESTYRAGGWTIRQIVHHVPDSHMNAYIRMKLAVTEESPHVKAYDEVKWAELTDVQTVSIGVSLDLLEALHVRWVAFLHGLPEPSFRRTCIHPELGTLTVDDVLAIYAWHGRHHAAHIASALRSSKAYPATA